MDRLTPKLIDQKARLGDYLVEKGLISKAVLEAALAEQRITKDKLGMILTRNGFLTRKSLVGAVLELYPDRLHGEQTFTMRVPAKILLELNAMIVAETEEAVYIGSPSSEKQIRAEIGIYYPELELRFVPYSHEQLERYLSDLKSIAMDEENLVERLMRRALAEQVSDVHIIPRFNSYSVFFRYLGVRHLAHEGTLDEYNTLSARIKDLSRMDLAERRLPQDGGFQIDYNGKIVDLRVATLPSTHGEYLVIRLLDPDRVQPSLELLGITKVVEWRSGVSRPDGLCLICGPTGSGKTTTLNASIKEMDRFSRAIYSVEDPVEYRIAYTGQVNVNPPLGLDFARALRAFMRADPDVIVLGEVRDPETARNAVKAAETGHLVLATLHTGSIFGAVQRLKDLEVAQNELRHLLRVILVQRLVRTTCVGCGGDGVYTETLEDGTRQKHPDKGVCPECFGTGFAGRTIVSECSYFPGEREVTKMLAGEKWWPDMLEDAVLKAKKGITTREEVARVFGVEAERAMALAD